MRAGLLLTIVFVLTTVLPAAAQCPTNPTGGPTLLSIRTPNDGSGTDVDVGISGLVHNIELPGFRLPICLGNCDATTDPDCTVEGMQPGLVVKPGAATPMPLHVLGTDLCVSFGFASPPPATTGTANILTGNVTVSTTLEAWTFSGACPTCVTGACSGGQQNGRVCDVQRSVTVNAVTYVVSSDCQPAPADLVSSLALPLTLTSGSATQGTCPGQAAGDACSAGGVGTCDQVPPACTVPADAVAQNCCSGDLARACFPAAGVSRQGSMDAPQPEWPSMQYPKYGKAILASATCAPASGNGTTDQAFGLPGPAALEVLTLTDWFGVDTTTTSTSTTIPGGCLVSCDDGNGCTNDSCVNAACSNHLVPGIPGVRCLIDRMRTVPPCGSEALNAKLAAAIDKALTRADKALVMAEPATGKKHAKLLKKANKQVSRIFKKADKAKANGKVSDECHTAMSARTGSIMTALEVVQ
jgi:hypothetical protein